MNKLVFQKSAAGPAAQYARRSFVSGLLTRRDSLRLRRKVPSWMGLALFVLVADILLVVFVWIAVDFLLH
jgi:hypothetical protein